MKNYNKYDKDILEENRIVAGKGSSLRYIEDEERFSIDYHSSKNKGDGFAQFQDLKKDKKKFFDKARQKRLAREEEETKGLAKKMMMTNQFDNEED